jgi:hypothetical protein
MQAACWRSRTIDVSTICTVSDRLGHDSEPLCFATAAGIRRKAEYYGWSANRRSGTPGTAPGAEPGSGSRNKSSRLRSANSAWTRHRHSGGHLRSRRAAPCRCQQILARPVSKLVQAVPRLGRKFVESRGYRPDIDWTTGRLTPIIRSIGSADKSPLKLAPVRSCAEAVPGGCRDGCTEIFDPN